MSQNFLREIRSALEPALPDHVTVRLQEGGGKPSYFCIRCRKAFKPAAIR